VDKEEKDEKRPKLEQNNVSSEARPQDRHDFSDLFGEPDNSGGEQEEMTSDGNDNSGENQETNICASCGEKFTGQPSQCPGCDVQLDWDRTFQV